MTSGMLHYNSKLTEWMEAALGNSTALQMNISDTMEYIWPGKHRSDYLPDRTDRDMSHAADQMRLAAAAGNPGSGTAA